MLSDSELASPWFRPEVSSLADAIAYTLAYSDIFDYPLSAGQIHRYLVGVPASADDVEAALARGLARGAWEMQEAYYTLPGRRSLAGLRRHRAAIAAKLWPRALRYGRLIAQLPFIRMVALSGALVMDNVESGDDIDYFIVTEPGRLWLARLFVIGLIVKPGGILGDEVCPNYLISTNRLSLAERNLFVAHELAQMLPLYGLEIYRQMRAANAWVASFLPNASGAPLLDRAVARRHYRIIHRLTEPLLRTPAGAWLEHRERRRKIPALIALSAPAAEVSFDADQCKGHLGSHNHIAFTAFQQRVQRLRCL